VYLFTHRLDDEYNLGGKAKTLPEIYKAFLSKTADKQVSITNKDGIKPANDAAAPTKTQLDNLEIAYTHVRDRVGTNLKKILETPEACTNKVAFTCVDAMEHAYPGDIRTHVYSADEKAKQLELHERIFKVHKTKTDQVAPNFLRDCVLFLGNQAGAKGAAEFEPLYWMPEQGQGTQGDKNVNILGSVKKKLRQYVLENNDGQFRKYLGKAYDTIFSSIKQVGNIDC